MELSSGHKYTGRKLWWTFSVFTKTCAHGLEGKALLFSHCSEAAVLDMAGSCQPYIFSQDLPHSGLSAFPSSVKLKLPVFLLTI